MHSIDYFLHIDPKAFVDRCRSTIKKKIDFI